MTERTLRRGAAVGAATLLLLGLPSIAHANRGSDDGSQADVSGDSSGRDLEASAGIVFTTSGGGDGGGNGSLTTSDASWTPPACYYAPTMTPSEFKAEYEDYLNSPLHSGKAEAVRAHEEMYGEDSEYADHNLDKEGEGMWWEGVINENSPDLEGRLACNEPNFWVDYGDTPPALPGVPEPELLAELAYERITVPETEIELNPEDAQVVGLATWVWLDEAAFQPVEVTAEVDGYDIWATTRAEPVSLTLDPGTEDARLHPASGECRIGDDGTIGEPYSDDRAEDTPPCGLTYLRATHATGSYELTASLTWQVTWEGSDGSGGTLPEGVFETPLEVTVEEVQTIVR